MKKTLRAIVAALLAAVMVLGCTSAFAAESDGKLFWNYYDWEYYYDYAGELSLGENSISVPEDSLYRYYIFNAAEDGYYTLGFTEFNVSMWLGIPQKVEDGTAYDEAEYIYHKNDDDLKRYTFKLNKGENIIGFDFEEEINDETFEIAYEGDKIESVAIDDKLLFNHDIYVYDETYEILADVDITFSSGSVITKDYINCNISGELNKGQNTVSTYIFDEKFDLTVDVYYITDVVKDVEITNIEDYLDAYIYYDGYNAYYPIDETFTFTMADGSTQSLVFAYDDENYITLPDGKKVHVYLITENTDGEITFNVMMVDSVIKSYELTETKTSANENFTVLANNIRYYTNAISYYLRHSVIEILECDSIYEYLDFGASNSAFYVRLSIESFIGIFRDIYSLLSFLL